MLDCVRHVVCDSGQWDEEEESGRLRREIVERRLSLEIISLTKPTMVGSLRGAGTKPVSVP